MPNFHKSIKKLFIKSSNVSKKELEIYISNILKSYEIKCRYGEKKLVAFENSILNSTLTFHSTKEEAIDEQVRKNKSKKYRTLVRYEWKIKELRNHGMSYENISKYINSHRSSNLRIKYNKIYIYRFCKKKGLK